MPVLIHPLKVLRAASMTALIEAFTVALQGVTDTAGHKVLLSTVPEAQLRAAVLAGMTVLLGEPVWPGDRQLQVESLRDETNLIVRDHR